MNARIRSQFPASVAGKPPLTIRRIIIRLLAVALIAGCSGCAPAPDPARNTRRVVLVALDGATWRVMDPLLAAGELPHIADLISRGCRGRMKSLLVSSSARIWTTLATGTFPRVHGIPNFTHEVEGKQRLFTSRDVRVPRVWELASDAGVSVGVSNWWFTYPSAALNGFVISEHTIPSRRQRTHQVFAPEDPSAAAQSDLVFPPEFAKEIGELLAEPGHTPFQLWGDSADARARVIEDIREEDRLVSDLALRGAAKYSPRFQLVYLKGVDRASHRFWYEYEPNHPNFANRPPNPDSIARHAETIPDVYRNSDRLLGRLIEGLGRDDVVMLLSDHGFEASKKGANSGTHGISDASIDGIYLFAGGPISAQACPAEISIFDVAPAALYFLGVAIPGQMRGEVPPALFDPDYLSANPVEWTDASAASSPRETPLAPEDAAEKSRIERLRSLGYFEEED